MVNFQAYTLAASLLHKITQIPQKHFEHFSASDFLISKSPLAPSPHFLIHAISHLTILCCIKCRCQHVGDLYMLQVFSIIPQFTIRFDLTLLRCWPNAIIFTAVAYRHTTKSFLSFVARMHLLNLLDLNIVFWQPFFIVSNTNIWLMAENDEKRC